MGIDKYGPEEASKRLEKNGYHHLVTKKTVRQVLEDFNSKVTENDKRPASREEFLANYSCELNYFRGEYIDSRKLLIDITEFDITVQPSGLTFINASILLNIFDGEQLYGLTVGKSMASQGMKHLESFAKALPVAWAKLSKGMAVWDFVTAKYHEQPTGSAVFLCVNPEGTQQELNAGFGPRMATLKLEEHFSRTNVRNLILYLRKKCNLLSPDPYNIGGNEKGDEQLASIVRNCGYADVNIVKVAQSIPDKVNLMRAFEKHVDPEPLHPFRMSKQTALTQTMHLLFAIINRCHVIEVLHFHKNPLLDRRLLAIILRACPHVKMLGIYECPLMHFGDVIFLLDLIHEINLERDEKGLPRVESLDFYPRYHAGVPYKTEWDFETHGLIWKHEDNGMVQRGVLTILMLAVLKSRKMNIGLLMDENAAFMTYLSNIPMVPGKVFAFLDGLYRFLDLKASGSKDENATKQAMYDLLKAVRGGLEELKHDWPKYYNKMGDGLSFCRSCGYEFLREFFTHHEIGRLHHEMTCSGCILRRRLDDEDDHQKRWSKEIMAPFYPEWNRTDFNPEAPIIAHGRDLVRFRTSKAVRDPTPLGYYLPNGDFMQPDTTIEKVRDQKFHFDSIQGLPSLAALLGSGEEIRQKARDVALMADTERTLALYGMASFYKFHEDVRDAILELGNPDHYDEHQGKMRSLTGRNRHFKPTHSFGSAIEKYKTLPEPCKDVFGYCDEDEGDDVWTPNGKVKEGFW
ncbi:hypothetical protein FLONG3_11423, partial [Fusarium longipes]